LVNIVFNGMYAPGIEAVPASSPFYDPDVKLPTRDVDKAKQLLKQAGVSVPLKLDLLAPNEPDILQAAEVIQSMAKDAGFDIKILAIEFASSLQKARRGDYESYLIGWSGRVDIDGNTYGFLHSGQANNDTHYASPVVDMLLDEGRSTVDLAKRKPLYAQMWRQLQQDLPITYLWNGRNIMGMSAKLQGFRPVPDGMVRLQGLEMAN
jgi:peptide/nickel transport system substrate-binding protein